MALHFLSRPNTVSVPFKDNPVELNQSQLFPGNIFDLLPDDHECYLFHDIIQQLDTTVVEQCYSRNGQRAYHPRLITGILIYAYSRGVFSSRQIEQRCREDLSFMFIAGMNCPNFRVLSDFRKDHGEFFKSCFKQSVHLAMELNLASLGHISLDGSKFKANSSRHKAMSYKGLKEREAVLTTELEALIAQANRCDVEEDHAYQDRTGYEVPQDLKFKQARLEKVRAARKSLEAREQALNPGKAIEDRKQISFADHDARIMGKRGAVDYAYNPQISVDSKHQIIVGQHVSQNANDFKEVKPALEQLQEVTGRLPEKMSLDNGYHSGANLEVFDGSPVEAYIATDREDKPAREALADSDRRLVKADFHYDERSDRFTCPAGQALVLERVSRDGHRFYRGEKATCLNCVYRPRCCRSKKGEPRRIGCDDKEALRRHMSERMATEEGQAVYEQRKVIVEPVFGQIKTGGFRGFSVRGKQRVESEFSLVCTVHNLKKILRALSRGSLSLHSGSLRCQGA